jgi:DNA topoisomerase-1
MAEKLVIVESPAKARTIRKYLGSGYDVQASMGHVRDLPKSKLGVDVDAGFTPEYTVPKTKAKVVKELRQRVKQAGEVYLATDPDREGEAIAWHVLEVTRPRDKPVRRVVFHEVTAPAIRAAFDSPREIDMQLVNAQQARRILDRLVGYRISPLLWEKVRRGLSAGRVQSVAVRLVVEREREIAAFQPQEYWTVEADLAKIPPAGQERTEKDIFRAVLYSVHGKKLGKFGLKTHDDAQAIVDDLQGAAYRVLSLTRKQVRRWPVPPFITSTLQQAASRTLGFAPSRTMRVAQQLYEGLELGPEGSVGLITYMRTDSTAVSPLAQQEAREYIASHFGPDYLPEKPPFYKTRAALAQEAHEAIRPTSVQREPRAIQQYLERDQFRLYELIWKRFLASQMVPAVFDQTTADIAAEKSLSSPLPPTAAPPPLSPSRSGEGVGGRGEAGPPYIFRATGSVLVFPGFLKVYGHEAEEEQPEGTTEKYLPPLSEGEPLDLVKLFAEQHFTEPPPRYSEATLIKELEKRGIGRPSTYAAIVETIQERGYVERLEARKRTSPLRPTELGFLVNDLLVAHFPDILDYAFTSQMETRLDQIAEGVQEWVPVLDEFYRALMEELGRAEQEMRDVKREVQPTDLVCELCGRPMVIRWGRRGEFLACSGYPECKNTRDFTRSEEGQVVPVPEPAPSVTCEKCGSPMVVKKGRFGPFLACSNYPACKNTRRLTRNEQGELMAEQDQPTGEVCEKCGRPMVRKQGRYGPFLACSGYPECKNTRRLVRNEQGELVAAPDQATGEVCEKCGRPMVMKRGRYGSFLACSGYPECRNIRRQARAEKGQAGEGKKKRSRRAAAKKAAAPAKSGEVCEKCGRPMVVKKGRYGQFLACSGYPECKNTRKLG